MDSVVGMEPAETMGSPRPAQAAGEAELARRVELRDRLGIAILLVPLALMVVEAGGLLYLLGVLLIFGLATGEYSSLFAGLGQRPARPLLLAGVLLLIASEHFRALNRAGVLLAALVLAALIWHLVDYERGAEASGTDFAITLGGILYLGWLGRYFILLRALPDGLWWLLTVLPGMWLADSGAYLFGRLFGRRLLVPRLSPKKTWAGYWGSVLAGGVSGGVLGAFWSLGAGSGSLVNWQAGAVAGLLVGALGPLGDLGVSMLKRQAGLKDTGTLIAGHGGTLDRMDSWLVAVPVGYYFVLLWSYL